MIDDDKPEPYRNASRKPPAQRGKAARKLRKRVARITKARNELLAEYERQLFWAAISGRWKDYKPRHTDANA